MGLHRSSNPVQSSDLHSREVLLPSTLCGLWSGRAEGSEEGALVTPRPSLQGREPKVGRPHIFCPWPLLPLLSLHRCQGQFQGEKEGTGGEKARVTLTAAWQGAAEAKGSHTGEARSVERAVPGQLVSSPTSQASVLVALL